MTESLSRLIETELKELQLPTDLPNLYDPISYTLDLGGKRIRPLLLLLSSKLFGCLEEQSIHQALAVEIFHNFTLVHDDIMDNAPLRRGKSSVYKKWDINTAILSGDVMFSLSMKELAKCPKEKLPSILNVFVDMTIKVCEGQQMDMDFESRSDVTLDEYLLMIDYKTAYLLAGSLQIGALMGNASNEDADNMFEYGIKLGKAFQLMDDYLDTFGNENSFGKKVGGDILEGKKTYLYIETLKSLGEKEKEEFLKVFNENSLSDEDKINKVRRYFELSGSKASLEILSNKLIQEAGILLENTSGELEAKKELINLTNQLINRSK